MMRSTGCIFILVVAVGGFLCQLSDAATPATADATQQATIEAIELSPLATQGPKPHAIRQPKPEEITASIERGIDFLLADQRPDGGWGSPEKTKGLNIYASIPGSHDAFKAAVTSLCVMALVEAEPKLDSARQAKVAAAIDRGEKWLNAHLDGLRRANADALYNVWGHAYSLQALVRLHARAQGDTERQDRLKKLADGQFEKLQRYQFLDGGWGYYDMLLGSQRPGDSSNSFVTGTVLVALHEAKSLGLDFPQRLIDKALASMERQRKPDFSFAYGEYLRMMPMYDINRAGGSLGRSQVCNLALRLCGDKRVTDEVISTWLNRLYARNGWLSIGRKRPIPHESHFAVAGYFYYYGHFYAAMCIDQLPAEDRPYFGHHLAHIILPLQERDGSWWDYPFYNYHQQYGTAMAVMTLLRCQNATQQVAASSAAATADAASVDSTPRSAASQP